jgi:hypothetical protein
LRERIRLREGTRLGEGKRYTGRQKDGEYTSD